MPGEPFTYPHLSDYARRKLMHQAEQILTAHQSMLEQGGLHALMLRHSGYEETASGFVADRHYPKGDRINFSSGGQYFYHCHREDTDTEEHGHIHCFIRQSGWPKSWRLADIPERNKYKDNPMTHIIAIGISRIGMPIRLFTVNRWVSKESWFEAEKMPRLAKRFDLSQVENTRPKTGDQHPIWQQVDRWVEGVVHLFRPQLGWLYQQRDAAMLHYRQQGQENPYLDPAIEELSSLPIDMQTQLQWLCGDLSSS